MKSIILVLTLLTCFTLSINAQEKQTPVNGSEKPICQMNKKDCPKEGKDCSVTQTKSSGTDHKICSQDKVCSGNENKEMKKCCSQNKTESKS